MKKFKKEIKENKAITLVALVITIIVLLILAGVSIAQLTGNGLFEKAKIAKEESKNAQEDEEDKIKQYSNEIGSYVGGNRDYTPISYSTEEQDTGMKWIDGKSIYQKTITGLSVNVIGGSGTWVDIVSIPDIDIAMDATFYWTNGIGKTTEATPAEYGVISSNKVSAWGFSASRTIVAATIQYTKTTN